MERDLVDVAAYDTAAEAEVVRGILEAEGIPAWVADAHIGTAGSFYTGLATGSVRIRVQRSFAEKASALVRRLEEDARESREAASLDPLRGEDSCVACGAPFPEYLDRCPSCGLSYS